MRKILSIICALIFAALLPAAALLSRALPADTGDYIAQKYAGWNGVLQAWVCCDWECGGSFITWLNRCAVRFERAHEGVYIEFTPVSRQAMATLGTNGIRPPELVLFSPGMLTDPAPLAELGFPGALRSDLRLDARALPVAMGGTVWAVNPDGRADALLCDGANAAGLIALLSGGAQPDEIEMEAPGLDLGLPASAAGDAIFSEDALDQFIDGALRRIPVNAAQLARLIRLQGSGRGPDWSCEAAGDFACADQLLLAGVTAGDDETRALAREFALLLLDEESQADLAGIGAFSVTGETIHAAHSPYAAMDGLINSRPLLTPALFSEHSEQNAEAIVRSLLAEKLSARDAAARIGFGISLPNHPN